VDWSQGFSQERGRANLLLEAANTDVLQLLKLPIKHHGRKHTNPQQTHHGKSLDTQ